MHASLIVIDNFYSDPEAVRRMACELTYPPSLAAMPFPGRNSEQRLLVPELDGLVSSIVGEDVVGNQRLDHGRCRLSLAGDDSTRSFLIHVDPDAYWAGIVYLTTERNCRGGTELYRHIATQSDRCPVYDHEVAAFGASSYYEAADAIIQADSNDLTKWQHLMTVPMRFNRLVLMRPWLWHTAGASFGTCLDNGRLVQLFFFKRSSTQ